MKCTNYDFAYMTAKNGLLFALLFSRKNLDENNLLEFREIVNLTENVIFDKWLPSQGALSDQMKLFAGNFILTGSISGMIDPFVLHGISGALTSGKVAAEVFLNKDKAIREFKWLSKNYRAKKLIKYISSKLPLKSYSIPVMMLLDAHLRGVGFTK